MNEVFARRVEAKVRRPDPVGGITPARASRSWDYDPTALIEQDIRDMKGNLIAAAGQRINPLDFVAIRQDLDFIDGDDRGAIRQARDRCADPAEKLIFSTRAPTERMLPQK